MKEYHCPTCNSQLTEKGKDFPFCSARCRLLDLGAWAREQYRIKGSEADAEDSRSPDADDDESADGTTRRSS